MSQKLTSNSHTPSPPPPPPQAMSASKASDDHFNEYAPGHMPMPDFEALAGNIQNRASRRVGAPPARRLRHRGGRDGGAGAMGPSLNKVCAGGSCTCHIGLGGRHLRMLVHVVMVPWRRGRNSNRGRGGIAGVEEDGGKLVGMPSSAGLGSSRRSCTTTDSVR